MKRGVHVGLSGGKMGRQDFGNGNEVLLLLMFSVTPAKQAEAEFIADTFKDDKSP